MKVRIRLPKPHSADQLVIMNALTPESPYDEVWVACGTKYGKTLSASCAMVRGVLPWRGSVHRWVAPIYKQTEIGMRYVLDLMPPAKVKKSGPISSLIEPNKSDMRIVIPSLASQIQFWHGQNPEDLEGEAVRTQVNDEASKLKEQVYASSRTTWTRTRAKRLNISTPRGKKSWFYRGCMRALEEMNRAKAEGRPPRYLFITAPTAANPTIPRESIEEAKALLPLRLYRQYYEASFEDDSSVLPPCLIDQTILGEGVEYRPTTAVEWFIPDNPGRLSIVAGCDWAKKQDWTVLTIWDYTSRPFRLVGFLRMQGLRYTKQVVEVVRFLRKFKSCEILMHDKTGVGEAIDDLLSTVPDLCFRGFTFTNATKSELVNQYSTAMERGELAYPNWPQLIREHEQFEVETDDLGKMFYSAPEGGTDDIVFSCCLGRLACEEYAEKEFDVSFLEELAIANIGKSPLQAYVEDQLDIDLDEGF